MQSKGSRAEVSTTCPHCGQVLVRPVDFSAERLMYLHQKWGPCFPMARGVPERPPAPAPEPPSAEGAATSPRSAAG